jgi:hypothetical protein
MKIQKHKWKNYSKETSAAIEISDIFIRHELTAEYHRRLANRESKDFNKALSFSNLLRYSTDYNEIITAQLDLWKSEKENYEYKCLIYGNRTNSIASQNLCQICYKGND